MIESTKKSKTNSTHKKMYYFFPLVRGGANALLNDLKNSLDGFGNYNAAILPKERYNCYYKIVNDDVFCYSMIAVMIWASEEAHLSLLLEYGESLIASEGYISGGIRAIMKNNRREGYEHRRRKRNNSVI